jgi:DNA-binding response OmpR family regulator
MLGKKRLVIAGEDAFVAGLFARRFEAGHWRTQVAENGAELRKKLVEVPDALLIDLAAWPDHQAEIARIRKNPKTAGLVILALVKPEAVNKAKQAVKAGADDYLFIGHFVPSEAVAKVNRLTDAAENP